MKDIIKKEVRAKSDIIFDIAKRLYDDPELSFEEYRSSEYLKGKFREQGFTIEDKICDLDTAFKAVYDSGKEGASVAFFCEYDALPEMGHGCGHNMISAMSFGAAIGLKAVIDHIGGKIVVFGTPGEETDGAKVQMAAEGVFDGMTVGIMAHPNAITEESGTSMALHPIRFRFTGKAAHAAAAPEKGVNALDAVILLFNSINALRQHVTKDVMFHGIITNGGAAPNIVPDLAEAHFYVRAAKKHTLDDAVRRVEECAHGAEKMTGAKVEITHEVAYDDLDTNRALSDAFNANLMELGEEKIKNASEGIGSSDIGNVSYVIPSIQPLIGLGDEGLVVHTQSFADRTVTDYAMEAMIRAATAMAFTGYDVITSPELQGEIRKEFLR